LASSDAGPALAFWDLIGGSLLRRQERAFLPPLCLAITPDSRLLASGEYDGSVHLWGLPDGSLLQTLEGHAHSVDCLVVDPAGQILASGGYDTTVRLWRLPEGRPLQILAGHTEPIRSMAVSPNGSVLITSSAYQAVELWGLPSGRPLLTLKRGLDQLAVSPDGRLLVGTGQGRIALWSPELVRLSRIPPARMSPQDLALAQAALSDSTLSTAERAALEFIVALVRHRRRFDIHLDDGPRHIAVGAFDIEIAG
jgi:WD40 repeat protein